MAGFYIANVKIEGSNSEGLQNVLQVPKDLRWLDLELLLRLTFDMGAMQVKYTDEDGDQVYINSDNELSEAFKVAVKNHDVLDLTIEPIQLVEAPGGLSYSLDVGRQNTTPKGPTVENPEIDCNSNLPHLMEAIDEAFSQGRTVDCVVRELNHQPEIFPEIDDIEPETLDDSPLGDVDANTGPPRPLGEAAGITVTDEHGQQLPLQAAPRRITPLPEADVPDYMQFPSPIGLGVERHIAVGKMICDAVAQRRPLIEVYEYMVGDSEFLLEIPEEATTAGEDDRRAYLQKLLESWRQWEATRSQEEETSSADEISRAAHILRDLRVGLQSRPLLCSAYMKTYIPTTPDTLRLKVSWIKTLRQAAQLARVWAQSLEEELAQEGDSNMEDSYIKPTTEDCVMVENEDSATVVVEDLEELKQSEACALPEVCALPEAHNENPKSLRSQVHQDYLARLARHIEQERKTEKTEVQRHLLDELVVQMQQLKVKVEKGDREGSTDRREREGEEIVCLESGETCRRPPEVSSSSEPPQWFHGWMNKFKEDMTKDITQTVVRQTVQQILSRLEGAVITSVTGTSGCGAPPQHQGAGLSRKNSTCSATSSETVYCHTGVVCDHCDRTIVGFRYKCGNCEDYDLCEECEPLDGVHDPDHVFLKIRRPTLTVGRRVNGKQTPLLKRSVYTSQEEMARVREEKERVRESRKTEIKEMKELKKEQKEESKARRAAEKLAEKANKIAAKFHKYEEKLARKQEVLTKRQESKEKKANPPQEKTEEQVRRKEEGLKRRGEPPKRRRETPVKREKLDLPQFKFIERMDAAFIKDVTFPDGSHIQPGTRFTKRWLLRNVGTHAWTANTKLKHLWGGMEPVSTDVSVPALETGEEGVVSVQIIAPQQPGVYQSHWRLCHHGLYFGHRVWCHVVVDEKEVLEAKTEPCAAPEGVDGDCEIVVVEQTELCAVGENTAGVETDGSTEHKYSRCPSYSCTNSADNTGTDEEDAEMFEVLDIRERNEPKVSQTATPNNTPLVTSPPKSPTPLDLDIEAVRTISSSSSVEIVSDMSNSSTADEVTQRMTRLVQERMASLGLRPDMDLESLSSFSDSDDASDDSSSDFYIVPIPDCFNPELPCSTSTTTSVIVTKEEAGKSVDEMFTASHEISDEPLTPSTPSDLEPEVIDLTESDDEQVREVNPEVTEVKQELTEVKQEVVEVTEPEAVSPPEGAVGGVTSSEDKKKARESSPSAGEMASNITVAALGVLSQAAASAFTITKDVFHTLQAQNNYVPPKSNWKPEEKPYTPPQSEWTAPESDYTPPQSEWTPPEQTLPESVTNDASDAAAHACISPTPMDQLVEMGFANRSLNERLLKENHYDVMKVVQELVNMEDTDWSENRH